jgi:hypothetical protein
MKLKFLPSNTFLAVCLSAVLATGWFLEYRRSEAMFVEIAGLSAKGNGLASRLLQQTVEVRERAQFIADTDQRAQNNAMGVLRAAYAAKWTKAR